MASAIAWFLDAILYSIADVYRNKKERIGKEENDDDGLNEIPASTMTAELI